MNDYLKTICCQAMLNRRQPAAMLNCWQFYLRAKLGKLFVNKMKCGHLELQVAYVIITMQL
jgi:hypothetical protein